MKIKNLVTLALLFALGFSIMHEYAFAFYDDEHCTTQEYVQELSAPSNHGDICDIHFEYHQTYLMSENVTLPTVNHNYLVITTNKESYNFKTYLNFLKPPIV